MIQKTKSGLIIGSSLSLSAELLKVSLTGIPNVPENFQNASICCWKIQSCGYMNYPKLYSWSWCNQIEKVDKLCLNSSKCLSIFVIFGNVPRYPGYLGYQLLATPSECFSFVHLRVFSSISVIVHDPHCFEHLHGTSRN
jgi:hypothetical protein